MNKMLLIPGFFVLLTRLTLAHQDAPLTVGENGYLLGLPEKFPPVILNLDGQEFQVGDNYFEFPECVAKYFRGQIVKTTGTWYHKKADLPSHVIFNISDQDKEFLHQVLFSLVDAKPLHILKFKMEKDKLTNRTKIEFSNTCKTAIEERMTTRQ